MLDERNGAVDNEPIEEADNVQIGDVLVDKVGFKDVETLRCITAVIVCVFSSFII